MPTLDAREIMKILPHRFPMILVDRVTDFEPMKYARGYKNVTANEPMFTGHFPGNPVLPGVYMVKPWRSSAARRYSNPATWRANWSTSSASTR